MTKLCSARQEITSRAAPQHSFIVANMFGPVDWDHNLLMDEDAKSKVDFIDVNRELVDEADWDIVSSASEEPGSRSQSPTPSSEAVHGKSTKSSFGRGNPLCEANMFGPLDWALELMDDTAVVGGGTTD